MIRLSEKLALKRLELKPRNLSPNNRHETQSNLSCFTGLIRISWTGLIQSYSYTPIQLKNQHV